MAFYTPAHRAGIPAERARNLQGIPWASGRGELQSRSHHSRRAGREAH